MAVSSLLSSSQITSLIQQAQAADQAPAGVLQAQEKPIQAQISALQQVQGALSGLQSALSGLANIQSLAQRTVNVSPSGAVQATATNAAAAGTYNLSGIHLATAESLISSGSASASGTIGSGSLSITVGSGSAINISITSGQSSLSGIATAIDQANAGVQASVVFDGSKYHLVLTGDGTGTGKAFTVSGSGAMAGFSYSGGASGLSETQKAANASFSLNGLTISSGSNSISGVVPGLSLTLAASGNATLTVSQDSTALAGAAQNLVTSLNQVLSTIAKNASYSQTSGAGPLFGNVGLEIIRTDLLDAISTPPNGAASATSPYSTLSAIGFSVTSGGTVALNNSTFQAATQTNYGAVAALLGEFGQASNSNVSIQGLGAALPGSYAVSITSNTSGSVVGSVNGEAASGSGGVLVVSGSGAAHGLALQIAPGVTGNLGTVTISQGVYSSLNSILNSALASGSGSITGAITNLNNSITGMNKQIQQILAQAQAETQMLTQQFSQAQATLGQLSTVSQFLTTYFNQSSGG
ncbi:MAG TPA: flagellar filament capping protein FliD [Stellaceae bacterium]|nr:flagellar filament capping protein FliD [Stellaceae bacterium]